MEMIAMLGGLSQTGVQNPMSTDVTVAADGTVLVAQPPTVAVLSPEDERQQQMVKLVVSFAAGAALGFFFGRSRR